MKIFFSTYGCSFNFAETEVMAGLLKEAGHEIVDSYENSDLVIVNTCSVKNSADTKVFRELKKAKDSSKKIILAGCYPQARKKEMSKKDFSIVGTNNITNVVSVVDSVMKNEKIQLLSSGVERKLGNKRVLSNEIVGIVPISQGCLDACTYCLTRFARGKLKSYPIEEIISEIDSLLDNGVKEIWLTSQDNGCYGFDFGKNLVDLMNSVEDLRKKRSLEGKEDFFRVRIGMANPAHLLSFYKDFIKALKSDTFYNFIHIPVQSGSSKVLEEMGRNHSRVDFDKMIKHFKSEIPEMVIATDVIIGFPTETDEDFNETIEMLKLHDFDVVNISKFWKRPYTKAARMKPLDTKLVKERSKITRDLFYSMIEKKNKGYIGKVYEKCLMDEEGKNNTSKFRNANYKQIVVKKLFNKGDYKTIRIVESSTNHLIGEVVE